MSKDEKLQRSSQIKKQIQKQRIKREYAKAKRMEQSMGTATVGTIDYIKKIGGKVTNFFQGKQKGIYKHRSIACPDAFNYVFFYFLFFYVYSERGELYRSRIYVN